MQKMPIACILFNFLFFSWLLSSTTLPKVAAAAAAAADAATGGFEALNEEEITKEISVRIIKQSEDRNCRTKKGDWLSTTLRVYGQLFNFLYLIFTYTP